MSLRGEESLQSALERRRHALLDVHDRAKRMLATEDGILAHVAREAALHTRQFVEAVVPSDAQMRGPLARALGLMSREDAGLSLRDSIRHAENICRAHGCDLETIESTVDAISDELTSIATHGRELGRSVDRLANDPTYIRLCDAGYDDVIGKFEFWKFSTHRHRKEAQVVIARFGRHKSVSTFHGLKAMHAEDVASLSVLEGEIGTLERRRDALQHLIATAADALLFRRDPHAGIVTAWRQEVETLLAERRPQEILQRLRVDEQAPPGEAQRARADGLVLARRALVARAKKHYLSLARAHFVERTLHDLTSEMHTVEETLGHLSRGHAPREVWSETSRLDDDTGATWQRRTNTLDHYERIRDALVSPTDEDKLDDTRPLWDQFIDFDPGDFIDELVMERALAPVATTRPSAVPSWERAAAAAAARLSESLATAAGETMAQDDDQSQ